MLDKLVLAALAAAVALAAPRPQILVSTEWLARHGSDGNVAILHVASSRAVFDAGHIPGAVFVSLDRLVVTRDGLHDELPRIRELRALFRNAGVSDDSRIILYSDVSLLPATRAYFTLDYLGHGEHAAVLDGGLSQWKAEGRRTTTDVVMPVRAKFTTSHTRPQVVVPIEAMKLRYFGNPPEIVLDVRSAADYRASHIPGARNIDWTDNQVSPEDQRLKPVAALRALYENAGVSAERRVVTYCATGGQASATYFALKYLGYEVALFDGSMEEWKAKGARVGR
jgi:thiosulfate/3-mercaptopyruvate sulfurtransferase